MSYFWNKKQNELDEIIRTGTIKQFADYLRTRRLDTSQMITIIDKRKDFTDYYIKICGNYSIRHHDFGYRPYIIQYLRDRGAQGIDPLYLKSMDEDINARTEIARLFCPDNRSISIIRAYIVADSLPSYI